LQHKYQKVAAPATRRSDCRKAKRAVSQKANGR